MIDKIKREQMKALKSGDKKRSEALKLLLSALSYAKINKAGELSQSESLDVLKKEAKKRRESIKIYQEAGSEERAEREAYELALIEKYLPKQMGEAEIRVKVRQIAKESGKTGGQLIGEVMGKLKGEADGGVVAKIVASL